MIFVLHIGISKTGTSAIQSFLWTQRNILFDNYDILYPKTGIYYGAGPAHYKFTWFYLNDLERRVRNSQILNEFRTNYSSPDKMIEELSDEVCQCPRKPSTLILSSENFFIIDPQRLVPDLSLLNKKLNLSKTIIIIYLRRQDKWLEATYSQHVKGGHFKDFHELQKIYSMMSIYLDYYRLLSNWHHAFPHSKIVPRIYNRDFFPNFNIIPDFFSILGIKISNIEMQQYEVNRSLSVISSLVLKKINEKAKLSLDDLKRVIRYLIMLDSEERIPLKSFFTLPERIKFLEQFKESNERLFKEWFGTENKFLLTEEEIKFYEEQDKIPRKEIEKIIEDRYKKVLSFMSKENIKVKHFFYQLSKPKIIKYFSKNVQLVNIDLCRVDLLHKKIIIGGIILPQANIEEKSRLLAKIFGEKSDEVEVREIKFGLPSPGLYRKYPYNPYSKNARFILNDIDLSIKMLEIILNDNKILEVYFE